MTAGTHPLPQIWRAPNLKILRRPLNHKNIVVADKQTDKHYEHGHSRSKDFMVASFISLTSFAYIFTYIKKKIAVEIFEIFEISTIFLPIFFCISLSHVPTPIHTNTHRDIKCVCSAEGRG